ncbi:replication initiation factor domain-containing protein, partial [Blautia producta]|nr:replication initiation factor domain-containing protein [Blautia producta]NSG17755.1 replication initiation factor domain-containing protein [Blautia producta]NSJ77932.1 replication initiation factor domain-containing protein [Blautia producta]
LDRLYHSFYVSIKWGIRQIDRTDLIPYIQYDTKHGKGGI